MRQIIVLLKITFLYKITLVAKKKGNRILIALQCTQTGDRAYVTQKNKINSVDKLSLMKYNKRLRKRTLHKEVQKLK